MEDLINFNSPCQDLQLRINSPDCSFQLLSDTMMNTTSLLDCGRESLPFSNRPSMTGRESLQLLPSFDFEITGRESLSVLQVHTPDIRIEPDRSEPEEIFINNSEMNRAFLDPSMHGRRISSNISSISSFNSCSFLSSEFSKIYSVHSAFKNSDLNNAFFDRTTDTNILSNSSMKNSVGSLNSNIKDLPSFSEEQRLRIQSLPAMNGVASPLDTNGSSVNSRMCWSAQQKRGGSKVSSGCSRSSSNEAEEDIFNDSVFIEAQHLASQIADGSILETSFDKSNVLDCTAPPDWEEEEDEEAKQPKCDTETIFKTLDLMLPIANNQPSSTEDVSKISQNSNECAEKVNNNSLRNTSTNSASRNDCMQNLSDIFDRHASRTSNVSNISKSRDAKEILQNLSEILNNDNRDSQQKLAGQSLLLNLADILCSDVSKKCDSLEDSGHSSIEAEEAASTNDRHECHEVLDLSSRRGSTTTYNEQILDLSLKSKVDSIKSSHSQSFPSPKMLPPPVSNNLKRQTATMKNLTGSLDGSWNRKDNSRNSSGMLRSSLSLSKLKPRKTEEGKSGPLKALVPVMDMAKTKEVRTLKKSQSASNITTPKKTTTTNSAHKQKKTSTPINAPKLRPMAQSTPDERNPKVNHSKPIECSSQLKKKKFTCPVSPLARPNSFQNSSANSDINKSDSLPDLMNNNAAKPPLKTGLNRRHSSSDLKNINKGLTLRRSYSIGKENQQLSALKTLPGPVTADNKTKSRENLKVSNPSRNSTRMLGMKPFNLMSRLGVNKTAANV